MSERPFTKAEERRFTKRILLGFLLFVVLSLLLGIFINEKVAEIFFWATLVGIVAFILGIQYNKRRGRKG